MSFKTIEKSAINFIRKMSLMEIYIWTGTPAHPDKFQNINPISYKTQFQKAANTRKTQFKVNDVVKP